MEYIVQQLIGDALHSDALSPRLGFWKVPKTLSSRPSDPGKKTDSRGVRQGGLATRLANATHGVSLRLVGRYRTLRLAVQSDVQRCSNPNPQREI